MAKPKQAAIAVFTANTVDEIVAKGGSGDWVLNPNKASDHKYLVCCRKSHWNNKADGMPGGAAFLIGVIKNLVQVPGSDNDRKQFRYLIELSEYAVLQKPGAWQKGWRNPVIYTSLEDLGIDLKGLKFTSMKAAAAKAAPISGSPERMTIAQAKKALAATFGVSPDDIEINIRG